MLQKLWKANKPPTALEEALSDVRCFSFLSFRNKLIQTSVCRLGSMCPTLFPSREPSSSCAGRGTTLPIGWHSRTPRLPFNSVSIIDKDKLCLVGNI
mmetsp:Transcript_39274/g.104100  ORF Transcript_39274/g.104100 Transcript_39274/m.104100 type:complete len:97 (-) Transcript_39274:1052-1342(-)